MSKIFYVTKAKGGVGNSLFATNFAYSLSKQLPNKKILFLDTNQFSDLANFFGIQMKKNILNLNMFLEENNTNNLSTKNLSKNFSQVAYGVGKLDVLLSPTEYYPVKKLNTFYKNIIPEALKIYDYIIIDADKNNFKLLSIILPNLNSLLLTTTIDNPAITKTNSLLNILEEKFNLQKINIICNQMGKFSEKDLSGIFKFPVIGSLPTEVNGAWDNVLLGVPIVENKRLKFSKEITKISKKLIA